MRVEVYIIWMIVHNLVWQETFDPLHLESGGLPAKSTPAPVFSSPIIRDKEGGLEPQPCYPHPPHPTTHKALVLLIRLPHLSRLLSSALCSHPRNPRPRSLLTSPEVLYSLTLL